MNWKTMKKAELIEECERMARKLQGLNHATYNDLQHTRELNRKLTKRVTELEDLLARDADGRVEGLMKETEELRVELRDAREEIEALEAKAGRLGTERDELDEKLHDRERAEESKLYDTIEVMDVAVERCLALLPGFESPDETLAVYNARRALDDLALASRKLAS